MARLEAVLTWLLVIDWFVVIFGGLVALLLSVWLPDWPYWGQTGMTIAILAAAGVLGLIAGAVLSET